MEAAGLIVGCAGLAALFDSCVSAFEYFDTGREYGEHYQRAALKVELLRLKLTRWGKCVQLVDDMSSIDNSRLGLQHLCYATEREAQTVKMLLGDIGLLLERAEQRSHNYGPFSPSDLSRDKAGDSIGGLVSKVKNLSFTRQKSSSFAKKARWALQDKRKLEKLIGDLKYQIDELFEIFPSPQSQQQSLAKEDVVEIVSPSEVEEAPESVEQLEQASEGVDQDLLHAVKSELLRGHTYNRIIARENARLFNGDTILAPGMQVTGRRHDYNGVYLEGNARVQNGDQYGGKSIFED